MKKAPNGFSLNQCRPGDFIDFTQNHGVVSEEDADAVIPYKLRDEQAKAVQKTMEYFTGREKAEFLWNAKPRFGKTLSAYDLCINKLQVKNVLIVTNRPAIANSCIRIMKRFSARSPATCLSAM